MKHKSIFVALIILLFVSTNIFAVDTSLVDETSWNVSELGFHDTLGIATGPVQPVPWTFHRDNTVNAGHLWKGRWRDEGGDRIKVEIRHKNGETDTFIVVFVSSKWFVAVKSGDLYRLGGRRGKPKTRDVM